MSAGQFAQTMDGSLVRIDFIARAAAPKPDRDVADTFVIPVEVKGCRNSQHIGGFPSIEAALAWREKHLGVAR